LWFKGILGVIIAYLLGSIPTAYLIARIRLKKDIRQLGGGNVGALNTFKEVGILPGIIVALIDIGKGALAVLFSHFILVLSPLWVMLSGIAVVAGHLWMVFLKFRGGRGMGAAVGAIVAVLGIYNQWGIAAILGIIIVIPLIITRNIPLSMFCVFISLPFLAWFIACSLTATIMALVLGLMVGGKFYPTAIAAWRKAKSPKEFFFGEIPRPPKKPKNSS